MQVLNKIKKGFQLQTPGHLFFVFIIITKYLHVPRVPQPPLPKMACSNDDIT